MRISTRLPLIIVGLSIATSIAIGAVSYQTASKELLEAASKRLVALRETRAAEFKRYLNSIRGDLRLVASNADVIQSLNAFSDAYTALGISGERTRSLLAAVYNPEHPEGDPHLLSDSRMAMVNAYHRVHQRYDPWYRLLLEVRGYHDIFLLNARGDVVYAVTKEPDFAINLITGRWKQTGLAQTVRGVLEAPGNADRHFVDFYPHAPSDGIPASFISTPVYDGARLAGVLVLEMPIDRIEQIMSVTAGMGETGETFVVGGDFLMRTDSRFSSDSTILKTRVETEAVKRALAGETGVMIIPDYLGIPSLSAYGPVAFSGVHWAMLSEINMSEVLSPIWAMRNFLLAIGVLIVGLIAAIGYTLARSVTLPLKSVSEAFSDFGQSRRAVSVPHTDRADEIGDMARNFKALSVDIESHVQDVAEKNRILESLSSKLAKYLSPQVYEGLFSGGREQSLNTERKKLTVFFSDLKDFSQTTEDLQPEDLTYLLNSYFTEMSKIALQYGATIDKFIGDAMLIFLGDPETKGVRGDAQACVRMAIAMQRRMADLREIWSNKGYERPFQMRIGINTGFCNVGNFGSTDRMDYTIIGGEVNLAARLEAQAEPGGILMSHETYVLVQDIVRARELKPITVKGIRREIRPYAVTNIYEELDKDKRFIRSERDGMLMVVDLDRITTEDKLLAIREVQSVLDKLQSED